MVILHGINIFNAKYCNKSKFLLCTTKKPSLDVSFFKNAIPRNLSKKRRNIHPWIYKVPNDVENLCAKDAVYFSMHKFVGGVQTPGILVAKKELFKRCDF